MIIWGIQMSIISLLLIFLVHHLITYFKTTLTVPKFKDLVNVPTRNYETMMNIIQKSSSSSSSFNNNNDYNDYNDSIYKGSLLPLPTTSQSSSSSSMKTDLKNFLKKKLKTSSSDNNNLQDNIGATDITTLDMSSSHTQQYAMV